jgi:hypothetical protein
MPAVLALLVLLLPVLGASAGEIQPAEGAVLRQIHVEFQWEAGCSGYQLVVVEDDGSADPFDGAAPVADVLVVGLEPRTVLTSGLAFDRRYAWRVRSRQSPRPNVAMEGGGTKGSWGPTRRFEIARLPDGLPSWTVEEPNPARLEPGLTILDIIGIGPIDPDALRSVAVDRSGAPVWFNQPRNGSADTRQLRDGTISYVDTFRGIVTTLAGEIVWASPIDPALMVHHEMFPMPNGNFLALVFDERTIEVDGQLEEVEGERIVEFDRETNEVVWDWSTWDHYSLEDQPPPYLDHGHWIHANAVVYNERDNSVYISSRSLSRITRIDYDTREVVYNMGKEMPSGDVDFGDGLFHAQHAPELLKNGNMLLHDNGTCCDRERFVSRAIELKFNNPHDPTSASVVWEYVLPTFAPIIGDVDRMPNGNTLIASGGVFAPGAVIEVTRKGEVAWKLEAEEPYFFYRAERIPALVVRSKGAQLAALLDAVGQTARCRSKD